jgi:UDP-GlcNAc:undecaprenyl-phosphate GlcNAc-1-phosphate transferase
VSFAGIILLVSFISALSIILLTPFASRFGLVDVPNSQRKFHEGHIPLIGGVSIYAGLVIGLAMAIKPDWSSFTYLLCSSIIVALGVMDDLKDLSPKLRLLVQSVVAALMCGGTGLYIHNLGDLFGMGSAIDIGMFGYVLTLFAVIGAINAFNMIDGVDGLLGICSLITFVGMAILFSLNHDSINMNLALIVSAALVPYLVANLGLSQSLFKKIFMGDTGSMLIGLTVVWLLVQGTHAPISQPSTVALDTQTKYSFAFSAATALWLIAFPLMDMVRVIGGRMLRKKSPLEADRSHLHHILQDASGNSKRVALLKICTLSAFFATVGIAMHVTQMNEGIILLTFLMAFVLYAYRVNRLDKKIAK